MDGGRVAGGRSPGGWRRALGLAAGLGVALAAACSGGDGGGAAFGGDRDRTDRSESSDPAVDDFCDGYNTYLTMNGLRRQVPVPQDAGPFMAVLEDVRPPERIEQEWDTWVAALRSYLANPAEAVGPMPGDAILTMWTSDCVHERGYDVVPQAGIDREDDPDELPPYERPQDDGELRTVEQGFSPMTDDAGDPMVSYGIVVENTSDQVATNVEVSVTMVDEAGEAVVDTVEQQPITPYTIPVLLPHQRFGIGRTTYVERAGVARLEVDVGAPTDEAGEAELTPGTEWWPADHEAISFHEVRVSDIATARDPAGPYTVSFTVESEYPSDWPQRDQIYAVLRDSAGEIVGGARDSLLDQGLPAGTSDARLRSNYPVPDVDDARTEVYV